MLFRSDVIARAELTSPVNTEVRDLPMNTVQYLGPASLNSDGTLVRALAEVPWVV